MPRGGASRRRLEPRKCRSHRTFRSTGPLLAGCARRGRVSQSGRSSGACGVGRRGQRPRRRAEATHGGGPGSPRVGPWRGHGRVGRGRCGTAGSVERRGMTGPRRPRGAGVARMVLDDRYAGRHRRSRPRGLGVAPRHPRGVTLTGPAGGGGRIRPGAKAPAASWASELGGLDRPRRQARCPAEGGSLLGPELGEAAARGAQSRMSTYVSAEVRLGPEAPALE